MEILINYKNRTLISPSDQAQENIDLMVKEAKLQLDSDILATERELLQARQTATLSRQKYPLNVQEILDADANVESLECGLTKLQELKKEFGFE